MKSSMVALSGAVALAVAELHAPHAHAHLHAARHGSPIEARDAVAVTELVAGPVVTVYVLNGKTIPDSDVEAGLENGKYVLITPSSTSTSSTSSTSTVASSTAVAPQQFFEKTTSTSTTPTPTPTPTTSSVASSSSSASSTSASSSSSGSGDINAEFPSGTISCSDFSSVSEYGPINVPWLGLGGWIGIQNTPNFIFGVDKAISYIETALSGSGCTSKSFCSYACPAGYQKSQWPTAQGNTGQSIGGLYCNANGKLELSNPSESQLCTAGVPGVKVTNKMSKNVCVCRTDYPGSEGETVPLDALPGQTSDLTCPDSNDYYKWQGSDTTAQYYINPAGAECSKACIWGSEGTDLGNWAPVNAGVGQNSEGTIYLSLFPNSPTNPDGVLDYTISITGASGQCKYSSGTYYSNGVESPTGCTVSGPGTFVFSD